MDDVHQLSLSFLNEEPCKGPHRHCRYMISIAGQIYDCGCARASAAHVDQGTRRLVTTSVRNVRFLVPTQMELHRVIAEVQSDELIRISEG